ncbi:MAG: hypothetical protein GYA36_04155 [Veillonellaceae bacterium]|nr:hypothetical protein [Veillonellaceae bacterium]
MKTVTFLFVTGSSWLDYLVTTVTQSRWSHVALRFEPDELLVEALVGQGLILQPGSKYDEWTTRQAISRDVPERVYYGMLEQSRRWARQNIPYGYRTSLAIGLKELLGEPAGKWVLQQLSGGSGSNMVCSELIVELWRMAEPDFLHAQEARLVSPDDLYRLLTVTVAMCR